MRHNVGLEGFAFRLRPVAVDDAADIVDLRRDPGRSQFIHETSPSVAVQTRWLEKYFRRDGDYYWAAERLDDGRMEGVLGVYDVAGNRAEWGRWVLRPGSLAAAESAWLVHEAAFEVLRLDTLISRTLTENQAVVSFHARYGAETVRILPGYARIGDVVHDAVEARMTRERWATAGPRLRAIAQRTASLTRRTGGG